MSKKGTFDRITTGWKLVNGRYYLTIRYSNSDTGEQANEVSTKWFETEDNAAKAATALAYELRKKLTDQ